MRQLGQPQDAADSASPAPPNTDPAGFRNLMSSFPTGVAVVTATGPDGAPRGLTCSSLCGVSADPPILLVCVHNASGTLAAMRARGTFAVNLLSGPGRVVAEVLASGDPDRFDRLDWQLTPNLFLPSLPAISHAVAECRISRVLVAGDHTVVFGRVLHVVQRDQEPPLLYGLRRFATWS
jgi:flavin reductase (DIM6/NTAB) family NADH-FMN oxidoreductase RutF